MFGYRLIREQDYSTLLAEVATLRGKLEDGHVARTVLYEKLGAAQAESASAKTALDYLKTQANTAVMEAAQYRAKFTGIPSVAPQYGTGNPLSAEGIGAGADLFDDVGDDRARAMQSAGQLDTIPPFPSAEALTAPTST